MPIANPNYNSPPLPEDYSEDGRLFLENMNLSVPTEPSDIPNVLWSGVRALDALGRCGRWDGVSEALGLSKPKDAAHHLVSRLGARTVSGAMHGAASIGLLALPPLPKSTPEALPDLHNVLLRGLASGLRVNELPTLTPQFRLRKVESALKEMLNAAGVPSPPALVYWAHEYGHLTPLRRHPNPMGYYWEMSMVSRCRELLGRIYPEEVTISGLPNNLVRAMAVDVPDALPKMRIDRVAHRERLVAWLEHEQAGLHDWAEEHNTTTVVLKLARKALVKFAREGLPFADLKARALKQLNPDGE